MLQAVMLFFGHNCFSFVATFFDTGCNILWHHLSPFRRDPFIVPFCLHHFDTSIKSFIQQKDNNFYSNLGNIFAVKFHLMKKWQVILSFIFLFSISAIQPAYTQCSICTKTVSQLGEKPARGMNSGILYLMFAPLAIATFIGFRWWKHEKAMMEEEDQ
jgi:hypothetical protein